MSNVKISLKCFKAREESEVWKNKLQALKLILAFLYLNDPQKSLKHDQYNNLRRNPPEVQVTSGQKPCTNIIYIVLKTSAGLFSISSKNNSILTTPNVENECWTSYETLESSGEMKLMMKFCLCLHKISELWNLFSLAPVAICFRCYFRQLSMYLALRKCKNDCQILKITLVQIFVH